MRAIFAVLLAFLIGSAGAQETGSYPNAQSPLTGSERLLGDQGSFNTVNITSNQLAQFAASYIALNAPTLGIALFSGSITVGDCARWLNTGILTDAGAPCGSGGGGGGSVTSVGLSMPSIFGVSGSPITSSGTIQVGFAGQNQNLVFASPNGSPGTPSFRSIVAADLPSILTSNTTGNAATATQLATTPTACPSNQAANGIAANGNAQGCLSIGSGSVTSVGLTAPAWLTVSGSPVTGSGTLGLSSASETANQFLASPNGSSGTPSFRAIVGADLPAINLAAGGSGGVTGILPAANGGTGEAGTITGVLYGNATSAATAATAAQITNAWTGTPSSTNCLGSQGALLPCNGGSGGGTPAGSSGAVQYNGSGSFAGLLLGAGQLLQGSGSTPTATSTITLGGSGTLGSVTMGNASNGTVTLQPATGALGTVTASLPANTGTIAETNLAQTFSALQTFGTNISIGGQTAAGATGTGNIVFASSPSLTTPNLGTPSAVNLSNATNLPASAINGTTGSGNVVLATSPTISGLTNSKAGAASTPATTFSGAPFTGGTGTTTFPLFYFDPTGATAPTTFSTNGTFMGINAPSGFTGNFVDYRVNGGTSVYSTLYQGSTTAASLTLPCAFIGTGVASSNPVTGNTSCDTNQGPSIFRPTLTGVAAIYVAKTTTTHFDDCDPYNDAKGELVGSCFALTDKGEFAFNGSGANGTNLALFADYTTGTANIDNVTVENYQQDYTQLVVTDNTFNQVCWDSYEPVGPCSAVVGSYPLILVAAVPGSPTSSQTVAYLSPNTGYFWTGGTTAVKYLQYSSTGTNQATVTVGDTNASSVTNIVGGSAANTEANGHPLVTAPTSTTAGQCYETTTTAGLAQLASCGGGGGTFQVNGTNLASSSTINFENSAAFNGLTATFANPSAGNVQLGFSGSLNLAGLSTQSANTLVANATGSTAAPTAVGIGNGLSFATGSLAPYDGISAQSGTSLALVCATIKSTLLTQNNSASSAWTLPAATTSNCGVGFSFRVQNAGAGTLTITPTTSSINGQSTLSVLQNTGCKVVSDGTNYQVEACTALTSNNATTINGASVPASTLVLSSNSSSQLVASSIASNTVLGNVTGSSAAAAAVTMPNLQAALTAANAQTYSPTISSGTAINDWDPTGGAGIATAGLVYVTPSVAATINGMLAGSNMQETIIFNASAIGSGDTITLVNQSSSDTTAANRFMMQGNTVIPPQARLICFYYGGSISRWNCQ